MQPRCGVASQCSSSVLFLARRSLLLKLWLVCTNTSSGSRYHCPKSNETGLGETVTKEANAAVERVMEAATTSTGNTANAATGRKRKYTHFTPEQRAKVARYAVQSGNMAAIRHFNEEFPSPGESTVRVFKKQYLKEVKKQGLEEEMSSLPK